MYAVIKTGGKQYKVAANDVLAIEKLAGNPGATIEFDQVLLLGGDAPVVGAPIVSGAAVRATVLAQKKAEKILIFKKKRRQNYRRKNGHRQLQTVVRIGAIFRPGETRPAIEAAQAAAAPAKAAPKKAAKKSATKE